MFVYNSIQEQLLKERQKTVRLQAALDKTSADVEYLAMMTDVELGEEENADED